MVLNPRHQRILGVQSKAHDFVGFRAVSVHFHGLIHRFIGAFYRDLLNPCVCSIRRVARRERPARWGFAAEARARVALHRAALCMPYAAALLNR